MSEITREEAIKEIEGELKASLIIFEKKNDKKTQDAFRMAIEALKEQRPHGEWVGEFHPTCSVCGDFSPIDSNENPYDSNFCPNCGADMRGGKK